MKTPPKVPTFDEVIWPTLQALKETAGSASNQELLTRVVQLMAIPEEVQNLPHGDGPRTEVEFRLQWARLWLGKVGVRLRFVVRLLGLRERYYLFNCA